MILRDLDLLAEAARAGLVRCNLSIGTLDEDVWHASEPGTPPPLRRVEAVARLNEAGVPCGVLVAPVLPGMSDSPEQLAAVVEACVEAGAVSVSPILLHLRPGVRELFMPWLEGYRPDLVERYRTLYAASYAERRRPGPPDPGGGRHRRPPGRHRRPRHAQPHRRLNIWGLAPCIHDVAAQRAQAVPDRPRAVATAGRLEQEPGQAVGLELIQRDGRLGHPGLVPHAEAHMPLGRRGAQVARDPQRPALVGLDLGVRAEELDQLRPQRRGTPGTEPVATIDAIPAAPARLHVCTPARTLRA